MPRKPDNVSTLDWLLPRVKKADNGCWEWIGANSRAKRGKSYGRLNVMGEYSAHRVFWRLYHGDIPDGKHVLHHCDNPPCVNPDHLFLGTHKINMKDKADKGRLDVKGEKNPSARLTEPDVRHIRERIANGDACYQIGREHGVTGEAILAIKYGRTWTHVS